ncbi:MAG TPA: class I SAM-dependent methyltransferase [Pyrinomonadaceae bacterium]|nr:class I SAM-dependent methyltransferase [Pyrinomonadaceae bacterium]
MKQLISPRFKYDPSQVYTSASASQMESVAVVRQKLTNGEYRLRSYPCPCGAPINDVMIAEVDRYGLPLTTVVCIACGTLRLEPYLDEVSLEDFYLHHYQQMYARAKDMRAYLANQHAYGRKILSLTHDSLAPGSWVFEVGCGAGGALKSFQEAGYRVAGCDYSARLVSEARQNGIEHAQHGTLDDLGKSLGDAKADLIYLHHVLEHLNDPFSFLLKCRQSLNAKGRVLVIVPDVSRIDSFPNPDGDLMVFLHLAHKFNFSFTGLQRLCERAGYSVNRLSPDAALKTANSDMPELWLEMRVQRDVVQTARSKLAEQSLGEEMRSYLVNTEQHYETRRRRAQLSARIKRVFPLRILRKLHLTS